MAREIIHPAKKLAELMVIAQDLDADLNKAWNAGDLVLTDRIMDMQFTIVRKMKALLNCGITGAEALPLIPQVRREIVERFTLGRRLRQIAAEERALLETAAS